MIDDANRDRPALPRDAFRAQRVATDSSPGTPPAVVTPAYDDGGYGAASSEGPRLPGLSKTTKSTAVGRTIAANSETDGSRNPFEVYGERTSSRPYALRLPDPIDFVLRQLAAEERTQPLRIIDRILYDHLKRIGRLPPSDGS